MSGCYPGCFYYTDSCFRRDCKKDNAMTRTGFSRLAMDSRSSQGARAYRELTEKTMHSIPAHKQTDPAKLPGQVTDQTKMRPTQAQQHAESVERGDAYKSPRTAYKPAHGGYPG